jgi:hypothetical protein
MKEGSIFMRESYFVLMCRDYEGLDGQYMYLTPLFNFYCTRNRGC